MSLDTRRLALLLSLVLGYAGLTACDGGTVDPPSDDAGVSGTDGGAAPDGSRPPPPPPPPPPPMTAACGGETAQVGHRLFTLGRQRGLLQPSTGRVLAFPERLSAALGAMPVLELTEDGGRVTSVAVSGDVPAGRVYGAVYQESLDRFVVLSWSREPEPHYEISTVELGASTATFTGLSLVNAPEASGFLVNALHAMSGNRVAALRSNDALFHVTVTDTDATFSDAIAISTADQPSTVVSDPAGGRLIGYGLPYDPADPFAMSFLPYVATLSLESGGAWVEMPTAGDVPETLRGDDTFVIYEPWAAYDNSSDRLTVVHVRFEEDPFFPGERFPQALLYALDVGAGTWQLVSESPDADAHASGQPWLVDPGGHRALSLGFDGLTSLHLEGSMAGRSSRVPLESGAAGPRSMVAAVALPDGRVVATDRSGEILALDTRADALTWTPLGEASVPNAINARHSLVYDPIDDSILLFGGATTHSSPAIDGLHRIDLDGTAVTPLMVAGGPPARGNQAALVHEGRLYIAGGLINGQMEPANDVWELDLTTLSWRMIATLPMGRYAMHALVVGSELWLVGGINNDGNEFVGVPRVDAVDLASGAVREVSVAGEWPGRQGIFAGGAPFDGGFLGFDLVDDTIDGNLAVLYFLEPEGDSAAWRELGGCFLDGMVHDTRGVAIGPTEMWAVGEHVFSLSR